MTAGRSISAITILYGSIVGPMTSRTARTVLRLGLTVVYQDAEKLAFAQAAQEGPDARRRAIRGARRTYGYVAASRERANAADGPFSAAC
jgi:hypothetical protein